MSTTWRFLLLIQLAVLVISLVSGQGQQATSSDSASTANSTSTIDSTNEQNTPMNNRFPGSKFWPGNSPPMHHRRRGPYFGPDHFRRFAAPSAPATGNNRPVDAPAKQDETSSNAAKTDPAQETMTVNDDSKVQETASLPSKLGESVEPAEQRLINEKTAGNDKQVMMDRDFWAKSHARQAHARPMMRNWNSMEQPEMVPVRQPEPHQAVALAVEEMELPPPQQHMMHMSMMKKQPPAPSFVHFTAGHAVTFEGIEDKLLQKPNPYMHRPSGAARLATENEDLAPQIIRVANRPSDIFIRNLFQDKPKAWIDLRVSMDDKGMLHVEVGPQTKMNETAANAQSLQVTAGRRDVLDAAVEDLGQDHDDLAEEWRQSRGRPVGPTAGTPMRNKRVPFWLFRHHPEPRFGYDPVFAPRHTEENDLTQQTSQLLVNNNHNEPRPFMHHHQQPPSSDKDQGSMVMGPSNPPITLKRVLPSREEVPAVRQVVAPTATESQPSVQLPMRNAVSQKTSENSAGNQLMPAMNVMVEKTRPVQQPESVANESDGEVEIKPVINIDDFEHSGCEKPNCGRRCPGDLFKLNLDNGCPMCECCPDIVCRATCAKGFDSDQYGCPICRCVQ